MKVLGIETSCDETGIAIYDSQKGLQADVLYSQVALHRQYGGVVPELASRDHIRKVLPLIREALDQAKVQQSDIDGVAYTKGPGLIGALMVGTAIAKSIAFAWQKPAVGIHHMEGHLLAPMLEFVKPDFPFLALLVSGGHTQLVSVHGLGRYGLLGESLDDAAGEAFDKTAKMLELDYPGGPALAKLAVKGDPYRFHFPRPMIDRPGLDFSFSGLKTFTLNTVYHVRATGNWNEQTRADIARAFEEAVVETLMVKCRRAIKQTNMQRLVMAGGVSANRRLRLVMGAMTNKEQVDLYYPRAQFCTDNGAMIAYAGCLRLMSGQQDETSGFQPLPRWSITSQ